MDGVEGGQYEVISYIRPFFSPDGKWVVVADGVESKEYEDFVIGSRIVFDGPNRLRSIMRRDNEFFRVEIEVKE